MRGYEWLGNMGLSEHVRYLLEADASAAGWRVNMPAPQVFRLAGRARDVFPLVVFEPPLLRAEDIEVTHGYVVKPPHSAFEPRAAALASELGLGPRVIWADQDVIVEEYFPHHWSIGCSALPGPGIARGLAIKLATMTTHDLLHGFDDLPAHLFVKPAPDGADPRFIDWGRARTFPSAEKDKDLFLLSKLSALCWIVARNCGGAIGYRAFRQALMDLPVDGFDLARLLLIVEKDLVHSDPSVLGSKSRAEFWCETLQSAQFGAAAGTGSATETK